MGMMTGCCFLFFFACLQQGYPDIDTQVLDEQIKGIMMVRFYLYPLHPTTSGIKYSGCHSHTERELGQGV